MARAIERLNQHIERARTGIERITRVIERLNQHIERSRTGIERIARAIERLWSYVNKRTHHIERFLLSNHYRASLGRTVKENDSFGIILLHRLTGH